MSLNVAEGVVKSLDRLEGEIMFGIPGSQTCPFYDALYSSTIRHVLVRHEQMAAYMADAYAKFTGKVGICDGTGGPGATNLLTGIATAWTDSTPVLAFTGQQPLGQLGKGAFQELDHVALFKPVTKWSTRLLNSEETVGTVRKAYRIAKSGRPGPVHIDLPVDVQAQSLSQENVELLKDWRSAPSEPEAFMELNAIRGAAKLLTESHRPVIIAGGGVHYSGRAWKPLRYLAEHLAAPVATTLNGRGSFSEDHPLSAGRMGVHAASYNDQVLAEADTILAVGCRFASLSTRQWSNINLNAHLIHVDIDPKVIGKNYSAEIGIVGDACRVLEAILEEAKTLPSGSMKRSNWLRLLQDAKESWGRSPWRLKSSSDATPLKPQRVCSEIRRSVGRDTVFTLDAGNNKLWAATFLDIYEPCTWGQSGCFGPMGYALPAAIACKLASPERTVVAICGDGGFYMSLHELSTAVQEGAPILVCIFNDMALGTIKHLQRRLYEGRFISVDLENPEFAAVAEAFECCGLDVEKPNQLRSSLNEGLRTVRDGQPAVINIHIDGEEPLPP